MGSSASSATSLRPGFVALVHDHRNFGASDGTIRHDIDPWRQIADWRRAISFLESQSEVDPTRIGVLGHELRRRPCAGARRDRPPDPGCCIHRSGDNGWPKNPRSSKPFLNRLGHKARRRMCPLYVKGLIGPGDRKSVQPMAERLAPGDYDQLHHFVALACGTRRR